MLEMVTEVTNLASYGFQKHLDSVTRTMAVNFVETGRDSNQTCLFTGVNMRTWMSHEIPQSQSFRALILHDECLHRFSIQGFIRRGQVDEIGIVGHRHAQTRFSVFFSE